MAPSRGSAAAEGGGEGEGEGEGEGGREGEVSEGGTKRPKPQTRMRRESCSTW